MSKSASATPPQSASQGSDGVSLSWNAINEQEFDKEAARHLLRRATWNSTEEDTRRAVVEGLDKTLQRLFPPSAPEFPKPAEISALEEDQRELAEKLTKSSDESQKRQLRREIRDRSQRAYQDLVIQWLRFARGPAHAASEKWVLFLSDIYVVGFQKVRNPFLIWQHHDLLRRLGNGSAVKLTQAVSRSPAMIDYLDLRQSKKTSPNENFARELFELFVLGEGQYTENDIKEAARAFTGYRQRRGSFRLQKGQHDDGAKTVFGMTGKFTGDDVIQLSYDRPAASTFLPQQLWRYYVSDVPLRDEDAVALGKLWKADAFDLRRLQLRVFASRAFFDHRNRGNAIKAPLHFYLGLLNDLKLDPAPLPRQVLGALRQMGQIPFNPPNVRGWVGGKNWINSTTLAARRQMVPMLFTPLDQKTLNADDLAALDRARQQGLSRFNVDQETASDIFAALTSSETPRLLGSLVPENFIESYRTILSRSSSAKTPESNLDQLSALLQSPAYQLC